ncbi:MAG: hypothetical protein E6R03_07290 [Hyphomicrobiaceae bacterium]|nr:MAG: hypothetical protein E6R03_07290 [Hyphomicrobiaceae bacterium]
MMTFLVATLIATSGEPQIAEKRKESMQEISEQRVTINVGGETITDITDVGLGSARETTSPSRGVLTVEGTATLTRDGVERLRWYMQHLYPNRRARRAMKAWNRSPKKRQGALNDRRRVPPGAEVYFS